MIALADGDTEVKNYSVSGSALIKMLIELSY